MHNTKARDLHIQSESIRRANEKPENAALSVTRSMRAATDGNGKLQMHSMVSKWEQELYDEYVNKCRNLVSEWLWAVTD